MIHIHWHKTTFETEGYSYRECRCGHRDFAPRSDFNGYQPVDWEWIGRKPGQRPPKPPPLHRAHFAIEQPP